MAGEVKKPRPKKCKACQVRFQPDRPLQEACSPKCAIDLVRIKAEKKRKRQDRERLKDLQPLSHWHSKAQAVFNEYIRLRDKDEPCISCGTEDAPQWCAGHYRSRGAAGHLRYNEQNVHKQCNHHCNQKLSGNIENYRVGLIKKIGVKAVEALENNNATKKWTREEIEEIRKKYSKMVKQLKKNISEDP